MKIINSNVAQRIELKKNLIPTPGSLETVHPYQSQTTINKYQTMIILCHKHMSIEIYIEDHESESSSKRSKFLTRPHINLQILSLPIAPHIADRSKKKVPPYLR